MTPSNQQDQIQSVGGPGDQVRDQDKIMLVLAYFVLFSLIPLLTVKDSDYVKFHAKQGLVLCGIYFAFTLVINFIPVIGQLIWCVSVLGYLVVSVMGIMKALKGERWRIPVVADLAAKF